jgi:hypothetical protein
MKTRRKAALGSQQSAVSQDPKTNPKQPRRGKVELKDLRWPDQRVVRFPHVRGKTAESIELLSSAQYHHITVEFADKTSLSFAIEPRFVVKTAYEFFRKGKPAAKLWPDIGSHGESGDLATHGKPHGKPGQAGQVGRSVHRKD